MRRWTRAVTPLLVGLTFLAPAAAQVCDGISPVPGQGLTTVRVATGMERPIFVTAPPGDLDRLFVVEQTGLIRILRDGAFLPTPFLDLSGVILAPGSGGGTEEGLLGLAFHPDYETNGRLFVHHTLPDGDNVVARYTRSATDADEADDTTRIAVLDLPHPTHSNHNGGMLAFGPNDGYLYIGTGDGGSSCDPDGNGQDRSTLNGNILRINVDSLPYTVPEDNPFFDDLGVREEIWAYGLRNPWRFSFDAANGDLYIGDVGQNTWEEIDYQPAGSNGGENYGWDLFEGAVCPAPFCSSSGCVLPDHVPPVWTYQHTGGACSVTGGYVYRGCRLPDLRGTYFFADYCSASIESFFILGGVAVGWKDRTADLDPGGGMVIDEITSFGVDGRGELYILDQGRFSSAGAELYKVVPILSSMEVSGIGASPFTVDGNGPWAWEDLVSTSSHPITDYRVYRSFGPGDGDFDCVHQGPDPTWVGGDPLSPGPGEVFTYLVTAVNAAGTETEPGVSSTTWARILSTVPCPG